MQALEGVTCPCMTMLARMGTQLMRPLMKHMRLFSLFEPKTGFSYPKMISHGMIHHQARSMEWSSPARMHQPV